jgi:hypothetical protein
LQLTMGYDFLARRDPLIETACYAKE